jgi:hypothetical protein
MAITVLAAVYGTATNGNDVTSICQGLVSTGNDEIPVNNTTLGPDPDFGVVKSFGILYVVGSGNPIALACQENTNLTLITS